MKAYFLLAYLFFSADMSPVHSMQHSQTGSSHKRILLATLAEQKNQYSIQEMVQHAKKHRFNVLMVIPVPCKEKYECPYPSTSLFYPCCPFKNNCFVTTMYHLGSQHNNNLARQLFKDLCPSPSANVNNIINFSYLLQTISNTYSTKEIRYQPVNQISETLLRSFYEKCCEEALRSFQWPKKTSS